MTKDDVRAFWRARNFDLQLRDYEGNCDLCMLKARGKLCTIIRENPGIADWWSEQERQTGGRFVTEYAYADLVDAVDRQGFFSFDDNIDHDAECGLLCGAD